ncbi:hypothetical protein [Terasakiella pusilla]|uniref:hypothetical protein n=1 Tax=Terasakiella pusilla TaxID=64973 RepID=UPI003AA7C9C2
MKKLPQKVGFAVAAVFMSVGVAQAGSVEVKIVNSTNTTIENQNPTCLADGDFPGTIRDGGSATVNTTGDATLYSCVVEYNRDDNNRGCRFVISRFWNNGFPPYYPGSWGAPQVVEYEDTGMNCSHNFTYIDLGTSGGFKVTLTVDD